MATPQADPTLILRQTDSRWLKRRAIEEFIDARNSGRLVAYLGSYASEHLGYSDWGTMWRSFCDGLDELTRNLSPKDAARWAVERADIASKLREHLIGPEPKPEKKKKATKSAETYDATTIADLLELVFNVDILGDNEKFRRFREYFISKEFSIARHKAVADEQNIIETLYRDLKVRRFLTTNYDAEIELQLMTLDSERDVPDAGTKFWGMVAPSVSPSETWPQFCERDRHENDIRTDGMRLSRYIAGRGMIVSDIAEREQYQRLTELALRQPSYQAHILHLHGRFDHPGSTLVTRRDYRDRYVQDTSARIPYGFATRQLFLGNPVLFVGLGGKEQDVMRTLEEHLSNNPNRRDTPTFLLWNSSDPRQAVHDEVRRIWFYRQYGVHVLYDHDIATLTGSKKLNAKSLEGDKKRERAALRMASSLSQLGSLADDAERQARWLECRSQSDERRFRDAMVKYGPSREDLDDPAAEHIKIWQLAGSKPSPRIRTPKPEPGRDPIRPLEDTMAETGNVKLIIADSGVGRGSFAAALGQAILERYKAQSENTPKGYGFSGIHRLISVNGAFTTELDSVFSVFSAAYDRKSASMEGFSRFHALEHVGQVLKHRIANMVEAASGNGQLEPPGETQADAITIILNGAERFIAHDGVSLSNELDNLIRMVRVINNPELVEKMQASARPHLKRTPDYPVNLILIGTRRVQRYLKRLGIPKESWRLEADDGAGKGACGPLRLVEEPTEEQRRGNQPSRPREYSVEGVTNYFSEIADRFRRENIELKFDPRPTDPTLRRRRFFAEVLSPGKLAKAGIDNVDLASQILRILAFLGQPSELEVLRHVPQVIAACDKTRTSERARWKEICGTVDDLVKLRLVLEIEHFDPANPAPGKLAKCRLALNKSLVMELRERYGLPLAESRLSAGYNLSLFAAQPFDNYIPDNDWHDDLRHMVDWFIGASRDDVAPPFPSDVRAAMQTDTFWKEPHRAGEKDYDPRVGVRLCEYYGVDRLTRMAGPEVSYCLRAALSLLRGYYSVPALLMLDNRDLDPLTRDAPLTEYAQRLAWLIRVYNDVVNARAIARRQRPDLARDMGHDPFYADDVLWIQNELGVVKLTQGDLYGARSALDQAIRINEQYVEFRDRQQNWCRLQLNSAFLDIEASRIRAAEERLRDIESAINERVMRVNPDNSIARTHLISPLEQIVEAYAFSGDILDSAGADNRFPTDLILSTALVLGYRGICLHIRGSLAPAQTALKQCLTILHRLGEQRAYSFFQRRVAGVYNAMGKIPKATEALRLCVAAAGPTRHPDIDHQGRVCAILYSLQRDGNGVASRERIPQLIATRRYARASDMYRLQHEAAQALALTHFRNGDHDSALRYASEALSIAARNGLSLCKINLRILLGQIVGARGDRSQALELIESAMQLATRIGYERAVESSEDLRISFESS